MNIGVGRTMINQKGTVLTVMVKEQKDRRELGDVDMVEELKAKV